MFSTFPLYAFNQAVTAAGMPSLAVAFFPAPPLPFVFVGFKVLFSVSEEPTHLGKNLSGRRKASSPL
jgi:hypothetical protein